MQFNGPLIARMTIFHSVSGTASSITVRDDLKRYSGPHLVNNRKWSLGARSAATSRLAASQVPSMEAGAPEGST
jgi:hypothetical protein